MSIGIASKTFDLSGAIYIQNTLSGTRQHDLGRRITRTATLDGGAAVYDTGYSDADRDITVEIPLQSLTYLKSLQYIFRNYSRVTLATPDGCYEAAPDRMSEFSGRITLLFRILSRVSS